MSEQTKTNPKMPDFAAFNIGGRIKAWKGTIIHGHKGRWLQVGDVDESGPWLDLSCAVFVVAGWTEELLEQFWERTPS